MTQKSTIFISETVLLGTTIPSDLLDSNCFELRSLGQADEFVELAKELTPSAVVIDLAQADSDVASFVRNFRLATQRESAHQGIPIIGIIGAQQMSNPQPFYQAGINEIISLPIKPDELRQTLQLLLNQTIRRYERKPINYRLKLSLGDRVWPVLGKTINLECVVVEGDDLPILGTNVLLTSAGNDPLSFYLWAHCWRVEQADRSKLILRFLNPSSEFLSAIDRLPTLPGAQDGPIPTGADTMLQMLRAWLCQQEPAPDAWQDVVSEINTFERRHLLAETSERSGLGEICALKILLTGKLLSLQSTMMPTENFQQGELIRESRLHETDVKTACEKLQHLIAKRIMEGESEDIAQLNRLKSELQRAMLATTKILGGVEIRPNDRAVSNLPRREKETIRTAPNAKATPPSRKKALILSSLLVLIPLAYLLSQSFIESRRDITGGTNWELYEFEVEEEPFASYVPLTRAYLKENTFYGVVDEKWNSHSDAEKKQIVRRLFEEESRSWVRQIIFADDSDQIVLRYRNDLFEELR
jgi:CheY-like chemotaxis protein